MGEWTGSLEGLEGLMKTILVTGASGFLGQAVIRKLVQTGAYNVIAVTSGRKKTVFPDGVIEEAVDLLDEKARAGIIDRTQPQILMHLAWAQEHNFRESLNNIRWLEASTSLLRHFAANNGECFFFAGTSDEYSDDNGKAHDIAYNQRMSMYGECKKAFATIMDNYCSHIGMRFIDGRFFTIYGKGDPHFFGAIPQTILSLLRNEPVVCKAPNTIRDYIHIDDAASAAIQLVGSDYSGSVNIASGRPIMMRDVFRRIATVLGKEHLLSFENEAICEQILVADCATLNGVIDTASFHSFETALPEMIAWWIDEDIAQSESDHVVVQITSDVVSKIAGGARIKTAF